MEKLLLSTYCIFVVVARWLERRATRPSMYRAFFVVYLFLRNRVMVAALLSIAVWASLRVIGVSGESVLMLAISSVAIGLAVSFWLTYRTMPSP